MSHSHHPSPIYRPVPRWVRIAAFVTAGLTVLLLMLGGFVTSFRVGMADPVWPTEPWYLANNFKLDFGYLVEHSHRIAGWLTGLAVTLLALAVWWTEPSRKLRIIGFLAMIALLGAYGQFHRGMGGVWTDLKTLAATEHKLDPRAPNFEAQIVELKLIDKLKSWPVASTLAALALGLTVIACGFAAGLSGGDGGWLRGLALFSLVAVMVQGLLGGFRVLLHARFGSNLAAIHGAFGQIAFGLLVAVVVLCSPRRASDSLAIDDRNYFSMLGWSLVLLLLLQLMWAVMLRHGGSGVSQRLHILTAFVVAAVVVALALQIATRPDVNNLLGFTSQVLVGLLVLQIALGVEAYLGKFAAIGSQAQWLPETRAVSVGQAAMRTGHQLVGCGLLAVAIALAIVAGRWPWMMDREKDLERAAAPVVASMAMTPGRDRIYEHDAPDIAVLAVNPTLELPVESLVPDVAMMALKPPDEAAADTIMPDIAALALEPPDEGGLVR